MEIAVFCVVVICEVLLAVRCLLTQSAQPKPRALERIGLLVAFVLLVLTSVVQWSGSWYAFGALLLIWAALSVVALLRKLPADRPYKAGRVIWNAVGASLLAFLALVPAFLFPQQTPIQPTGQYGVETVVETYTDPDRVDPYSPAGENRRLTVQYWYPQGAEGTFPLVVFSHGSFGIRTSNESLYMELASHGYVVCSIDHTYQSLFSTDVNGATINMDGGFMREVAAEDADVNPQQSYELYQKWMDLRAGDINFVIDTILAQAADPASAPLFHLVDPAKIGVMGHSMGGSAALAVGRMRRDVSAVLALEAPFMGDVLGVEDGQFIWNEDPYPAPLLNVYSDSSWSHLAEWPQYAENARLLTGSGAPVYNVYIQGARHLTLTDLALTSPILTRILNGQPASLDAHACLTRINELALGFFDQYLKNEGQFIP